MTSICTKSKSSHVRGVEKLVWYMELSMSSRRLRGAIHDRASFDSQSADTNSMRVVSSHFKFKLPAAHGRTKVNAVAALFHYLYNKDSLEE